MKHYLVIIISFLILFNSCKKKEILNPEEIIGLGGDKWASTAIDKWLYDSLTKTYNIQVKYKFDEFESDVTRTLVPPREELVIPFMNTIKKIFIDTYTPEAGDVFVKKNIPKQFVLYGSPSYNSSGSMTIGEAESGLKIIMYDVNSFDIRNRVNLKKMIRVLNHEFTHILQQKVIYSSTFKRITNEDYVGDWYNQSDESAFAHGFITPYAMSAYDEDFADMVAVMLSEGKINYAIMLDKAEQLSKDRNLPNAKTRLQQKEAIVANYYKSVWNIDIYKLQDRIENLLNSLAGFDTQYSMLVTAATQTSTNFKQIWQQTIEDSKASGFEMKEATISFPGKYLSQMVVKIKYGDFFGTYIFPVTYSNGEILIGNTYTNSTEDGDYGEYFAPFTTTLLDFIKNKRFLVKWPQEKIGTALSGGLYLADNPATYIKGTLN